MKITENSAASIIRRLNGDQSTGMCRCPCPDHNDNIPSLSVADGRKGVVVRCHGGCEQTAVLAALREMGVWPKSQSARRVSLDDKSDEFEKYERFMKAFAIMRAAALNDQTPTQYLDGRAIETVPASAMMLSAKASSKLCNRRFPAMIFPIVNADGKLQGAHVTFLTRDGTEKLNTEHPRKVYGSKRGGFIQFGTISKSKPLLVAEGVETALAASQIAGIPAIAAVSAANFKSVKVPKCSEVIIAADNDKPGLKAANLLAERLAGDGRRVGIAIPKKQGQDFNDILRAGGSLRAAKRAISQAPLINSEALKYSTGKLTTRPLSSFKSKRMKFLWEPFIPIGAVTLLYGDGDVGKSTITLDLAARLSNNANLPTDEREKISGSTLILAKEDDPGTVLKKRLQAANANQSKIHSLGFSRDDGEWSVIQSIDGNLDLIEKQVKKIGDVKLVVIDPLSAFAGKLDMNSDKDVRALLDPFAQMAARNNLAVIVINHLTKSTDGTARHRAMGSTALINSPRSALFVGPDPNDDSRRVMVQVKGNFSAVKNQSLGFRFKQNGESGTIEWEKHISVTNPQELLLKVQSKTSKIDFAKTLLSKWLKAKPLARKEIEKRSKKHQIGWRTMESAKKEMQVKSFKRKSSWYWRLPN